MNPNELKILEAQKKSPAQFLEFIPTAAFPDRKPEAGLCISSSPKEVTLIVLCHFFSLHSKI
jgi:hypothetical protein